MNKNKIIKFSIFLPAILVAIELILLLAVLFKVAFWGPDFKVVSGFPTAIFNLIMANKGFVFLVLIVYYCAIINFKKQCQKWAFVSVVILLSICAAQYIYKLNDYSEKILAAILNNDINSVEKFIDKGADVNKLSRRRLKVYKPNVYWGPFYAKFALYGNRSLVYEAALMANSPEIVKLLIDNGARYSQGELIWFAARKKKPEYIDIIVDNDEEFTHKSILALLNEATVYADRFVNYIDYENITGITDRIISKLIFELQYETVAKLNKSGFDVKKSEFARSYVCAAKADEKYLIFRKLLDCESNIKNMD